MAAVSLCSPHVRQVAMDLSSQDVPEDHRRFLHQRNPPPPRIYDLHPSLIIIKASRLRLVSRISLCIATSCCRNCTRSVEVIVGF